LRQARSSALPSPPPRMIGRTGGRTPPVLLARQLADADTPSPRRTIKMISLKKTLTTTALAALMAAGALAATAGTASAYMACNREGNDCWHTDKKVSVPGARFDYHPDDWYFHQTWTGSDR